MTAFTAVKELDIQMDLGLGYTIMMWNHVSRNKGTFAFMPTLGEAKRFACEYCRYLPENQVQVSVTRKYPIQVVYRLWNHDGQVKELDHASPTTDRT